MERGWAPGTRVFGRVRGVMGVGDSQESITDCRDVIGSGVGWGTGWKENWSLQGIRGS